MKRKTSTWILLLSLLWMTIGPLTAQAAEDPIVGTWQYQTGEIKVTDEFGTFVGVISKEIKFTNCVHTVGDRIWAVTKSATTVNGYSGAYVGFYEDCTQAPMIAKITLSLTSDSSSLKLCTDETPACVTLIGGPPPPRDTTPPKITITPLTAPVRLGQNLIVDYSVTDDSNEAYVTVRLYSGGDVIWHGSSLFPTEAIGKTITADMGPYGGPGIPEKSIGPYYFCVFASDASGNKTGEWDNCQWLSVEVPIDVVSNGCGGASLGFAPLTDTAIYAMNLLLDVRGYTDSKTKARYIVKLRPACNNHDAGYSGATVIDQISGKVTDFRTYTRAQVDKKFKEDIGRLCAFAISKSATNALAQCQVGTIIPKTDVLIKELKALSAANKVRRLASIAWGATVYWQFVHDFGKGLYDADATQPGDQPTIPRSTLPAGGARNNT